VQPWTRRGEISGQGNACVIAVCVDGKILPGMLSIDPGCRGFEMRYEELFVRDISNEIFATKCNVPTRAQKYLVKNIALIMMT
jgi:hypothetical protein